MDVVITFSAFNEEKNLRTVLQAATKYGDIIVVDDGSSDRTFQIARECGANVVKHPINIGQGLAVMTGFKVALAKDYDVIIEMDADGQHDPSEIPKFLNKMEESGADIVIGSRILGTSYQGAPWARRYFLPKLTHLINRLTGYNMTDSMCGFRAFRRESLRKALPDIDNMLEPQYLAAEMWIRFSRLGLSVEEVPINLKDRATGFSTKGLFRYGWGVSSAILRTLLEGKK